jgi:succinate dehydrogenase / fumarate reductase iron-sulfur subunit
VTHRRGANLLTCLMDVQKNPVTADGRKTTPVVWDSNCLEEVCGACSMLINGRVRQACSALVDRLEQPITVEPMTKFSVIRDLLVDRSSMFEALKRVHAWIELDTLHSPEPGPNFSPKVQQVRYELSRCMTCGCCLEACPQVNSHSAFIGPAAISQVRFFNLHPTGSQGRDARLNALMTPGGIADCGNAQNCVEVCPKGIPLTESIASLNRDTTRSLFSRWLKT